MAASHQLLVSQLCLLGPRLALRCLLDGGALALRGVTAHAHVGVLVLEVPKVVPAEPGVVANLMPGYRVVVGGVEWFKTDVGVGVEALVGGWAC